VMLCANEHGVVRLCVVVCNRLHTGAKFAFVKIKLDKPK